MNLRAALASAAFLNLANICNADVISAQSYADNIVVGPNSQNFSTSDQTIFSSVENTLPDHQPSVTILAIDKNTRLPFSLFQVGEYPDSNGVWRFLGREMASLANHAALEALVGDFYFKQIDNKKIYIGIWSTSASLNKPSHTVYYSGKANRRKLPIIKATYAVQGINNYNEGNLLSGDLLASFGDSAPTLTGSLTYGALKVTLTANINTNDYKFIGSARVVNPTTNEVLSTGILEGTFFGTEKNASLAGIAKFDNREYDSAFGGVLSRAVGS